MSDIALANSGSLWDTGQDSAFVNRGAVPCRYLVAVLRAADGAGVRPVRLASEPD